MPPPPLDAIAYLCLHYVYAGLRRHTPSLYRRLRAAIAERAAQCAMFERPPARTRGALCAENTRVFAYARLRRTPAAFALRLRVVVV